MSDILIRFLSSLITEELLNTYFRSARIISFFEKDDVYDLIDDMLMDIDNIDTHNTLNRIYQIHVDQLVNIITEYGISLNDDINLLDLVILTESMLYLEDYEDKDSISNILLSDEDNIIKLIDCLDIATVYDDNYFVNLIKDVNPSLLSKLYSLCIKEKVEIINDDADLKNIKNITNKLKEIKDNDKYNKSIVFALIRNGLSLYLPFKLYLDLFKDIIFNDDQSLEDISINLAVFGLISEDSDYHSQLKDIITNYVSDITDCAVILSNTRKYYVGV